MAAIPSLGAATAIVKLTTSNRWNQPLAVVWPEWLHGVFPVTGLIIVLVTQVELENVHISCTSFVSVHVTCFNLPV